MKWSAGKFIFLARLKDQPKGWNYGLKGNCIHRLNKKTGKSFEHYVRHLFQRQTEILQEWSAAQADVRFLIKEFNDSRKVWHAAYHKMYLHSMPIDYVLGWTPFMGLQFKVGRPTLIPRRDSEFWLRELIQRLKQHIITKPLRIYEVGTGTGCLAISLVKNLDDCHVTAIDISPSALELAKCNAKRLLSAKQQPQLEFYQQDIFKSEILPEFDVLICNPPYIPRRHFLIHTSASVRHWESPLALLGDHGDTNCGAFFHQKLLELSAKQREIPEKTTVGIPRIVLELNGTRSQLLKVQELAHKYGHQNLEFVYDEANRPRAIFIM